MLGYAPAGSLPAVLDHAGGVHASADARLLVDLTWHDGAGGRHMEQEIFAEILRLIGGAQRLILLDMFLFNDLLVRDRDATPPLSRQLTDALIERKRAHPDLEVVFISDPCNIVYGGMRSVYFDDLRAAGIEVVLTDIDRLRDGNRIYGFLWRLLVRPFGNSTRGWLPHPFGGEGRITLRSYLRIPNLKANHRKTLLVDNGDDWIGLVSTANPHDASFAHRNVALRFTGPAVGDLYRSELAVLRLSDARQPSIEVSPPPEAGDVTVQVLTESRIKRAVLATIEATTAGDGLDLILFYLADDDVCDALVAAQARGVTVRIVLDPSKDAFGYRKSGQPNRPVAWRLHQRGIAIRWAVTRGEQDHSKLMLARYPDRHELILGSANFTRRNLAGFNLESDVHVAGAADAQPLSRASELFEAVWANDGGRLLSEDYEVWADDSWLSHLLFRLMKVTGLGTF